MPILSRRRSFSAWATSGGEAHLRLVFDAAAKSPLPLEIAFLASRGVPEATLEWATRRAAENDTDPADELIALGFEPRRYWSTLAEELGVAFLEDLSAAAVVSNAGPLAADAIRIAPAALAQIEGRVVLLAAPRRDEFALLRSRLRQMPALSTRLGIATPGAIRALIASGRRAALSHYAINRLARVLPALSAGRGRPAGLSGHKKLAAALGALFLVAPLATIGVVWLFFTLFFLNCSYWKLRAAFRRPRVLRVEPLSDSRLPRYSVLVPLYREAAVVPDLVAHLAQLDYPALCINSTTLPGSHLAFSARQYGHGR